MPEIHELHVEEIPGGPSPDRLPAALFERPRFVLLESSLGGRWSLAAWDPVEVIEAREGLSFLEEFRRRLKEAPAVNAPDLPFAGGWIGYLGYELYSEIEGKVPPREVELVPKAVMAFYDEFYLYDRITQKAFLCSRRPTSAGDSLRLLRDSSPASRNGGRHPTAGARRSAPTSVREAASDSPRRLRESPADSYLHSVNKILGLIAAGDCYQVNLSQKFTSLLSQPSALVYRHLRSASPSPYAAFLNLGEAQILSSSPESFLEVDGRRVTTRPIKGTRPRGKDAREDARLKDELALSAKDRAELLMITDLERNDLGRVCRPGSVRVRDLGSVESYPQVHHLVATIEGELGEGKDVIDLLKATFPGGSITGAPKVRAMQIIRELEPHAREVYCGAIGYVSLNGKAQFNVAIRTMAIKDGQAHFWSGSGIVADSDPDAEYQECLIKAEGLKKSLGH